MKHFHEIDNKAMAKVNGCEWAMHYLEILDRDYPEMQVTPHEMLRALREFLQDNEALYDDIYPECKW